MSFFAMGAGWGTKNNQKDWLEAYFPLVMFGPDADLMRQIAVLVHYEEGNKNNCS